MQKNQANRATIARRIPTPTAPVAHLSIRETSDAARAVKTADIVAVRKADRGNRKATSLRNTQRCSSTGRMSDWARPAELPFSVKVTTHQSRWDQTVRSQDV